MAALNDKIVSEGKTNAPIRLNGPFRLGHSAANGEMVDIASVSVYDRALSRDYFVQEMAKHAVFARPPGGAGGAQLRGC
jgi:hypothetical protein